MALLLLSLLLLLLLPFACALVSLLPPGASFSSLGVPVVVVIHASWADRALLSTASSAAPLLLKRLVLTAFVDCGSEDAGDERVCDWDAIDDLPVAVLVGADGSRAILGRPKTPQELVDAVGRATAPAAAPKRKRKAPKRPQQPALPGLGTTAALGEWRRGLPGAGVVLFTTPWCQGCDAVLRDLSRLAALRQRTASFAVLDCDTAETTEACARLRVNTFPTIAGFFRGKRTGVFPWRRGAEALLRWVDDMGARSVITALPRLPRLTGVEALRDVLASGGLALVVYFSEEEGVPADLAQAVMALAVRAVRVLAVDCDHGQLERLLCQRESPLGTPTIILYGKGATRYPFSGALVPKSLERFVKTRAWLSQTSKKRTRGSNKNKEEL